MNPILPPTPSRPARCWRRSRCPGSRRRAALAAPAATLAAQGDNEVVIGVIEQVTPSVVTIQTDFTPGRGEP